MRRLALFGVLAAMIFTAQAQAPQPVPTIVPPTPVPYDTTGASESALTESTVARIQNTGRVRIGILYTEPPFGEFTERGEVKGLDADLARALAEAWGVDLRLRQVTRQTALELLASNDIDLLVAAQVHRRELDRVVEFSQTYYLGSLSLMLRADDATTDIGGLNGRKLGVVMGSTAEVSARRWAAQSGFNGSIETFVTLDRLYGALGAGLIDAVVAPNHQLSRLSFLAPDAVKILDVDLELEPYAIAFRRQDLPLRQLINRTLQVLQTNGKLDEIRAAHFTDGVYREIPVWANAGESAPQPAEFSAAIPYPETYAIPRIQNAGVVRLAGPFLSAESLATATESEKRLDTFYREFANQLVRRWGVRVEFTSAQQREAIQLVTDGRVDMAIGIAPDWNFASQADFSMPYLVHGLRLIAPENSNVFGFEDLRGGGTVATLFSEPGSAQIAVREAEKAQARIEGFQTDESSIALQLLEDLNADVAFADIFKLKPHLDAYPQGLRLTDEWYTREYIVAALPLNDADFRLLVDYSIQSLVRDGTLNRLWQGLLPAEEMPQLEIYPGATEFLGFELG